MIENEDAVKIIERHDSPNTLFYADPPYVHDSRAMVTMHGNHGYAHEMSDEQHRQLAELLHRVTGAVVLSGYDCSLYNELYGDWKTVRKKSLADGAAPRVEVLWMNTAATRGQHGLFEV